MTSLTTILTSGLVAAIVSATVRILWEWRLERLRLTSRVLGDAVVSAYSREVEAYVKLWQNLQELDNACINLEYEQSTLSGKKFNFREPPPKNWATAGTKVLEACEMLVNTVERNRPFIRRDIHELINTAFLIANDMHMKPLLLFIKKQTPIFDVKEIQLREVIEKVELKIRDRIGAPL